MSMVSAVPHKMTPARSAGYCGLVCHRSIPIHRVHNMLVQSVAATEAYPRNPAIRMEESTAPLALVWSVMVHL